MDYLNRVGQPQSSSEDPPLGETLTYEAVIAEDVGSVADEVFVIAEGYGGGHVVGPCRWMPRVDGIGQTVLPARGDAAILTVTDEGECWVTSWWSTADGAAPPPPDGSDKHYVHVQDTPASTWTVSHPLDKRPSVTVVDSGGTVLDGDVSYPSSSQVVVEFVAATSGSAYLN